MNITVGYRNLWAAGTIIACSSENPQAPAEGTQEPSREFPWRTVAGQLAETVDNDLGAALEYDLVGILGHNLTPAATIQVIGADDDAFSVNVVTDTMTHVGNDLWAILGAARTKRYVRLSIADAANPDNYLEVGPVVLMKAYELNREEAPPELKASEDRSVVELTMANVALVTDRREPLDVRGLNLTSLSDAAAAVLEDLLATIGVRPAWALCFDATAPNGNTYWVRIREHSVLTRQSTNDNAFSATLEEVR